MKPLIFIVFILYSTSIVFSAPGDLIWRYKTGNAVESSPCVSDGVVYISSDGIYAIYCSLRTLKWKYNPDAGNSELCVSDGVVYVGTGYNYLDAINCSDGTLKWRYNTGSYIRSSPCVSDGVAYIGSDNYYLYAIKTSSYKGLSKNKVAKLKPVSSKFSFALPNDPTE